MDRRQSAIDLAQQHYDPSGSSNSSQHIPRLSLPNVNHLPRQRYQLSSAIASSPAEVNVYHQAHMQSLDTRKNFVATSPVSQTSVQHGPPVTHASSYPPHPTTAPQQPFNPHRLQYNMQASAVHERHAQASVIQSEIQEAHPQNVSNVPGHVRRSSSGSFTTEVSTNVLNVMAPFFKQQEEKIDGRFSDLAAQFSQITNKLEKAANESVEETKTGTQAIMRALSHLAQKQQALVEEMQAVKKFVGFDDHAKQPVYNQGENGSLYQKLTEIAHLVGDWIEKAGDPEANAGSRLVDEILEYQKTLTVRNPSPVRHEMGTSPMPSRYLSDEDALMATDRSVRAATIPRVVRHEMAVSPLRIGEQRIGSPLRTSRPVPTTRQETTDNFIRPNRQVQSAPGFRASPISIDGGSQPDGDQRQTSSDTLVNGVFKPQNPLSQANVNPFQRAVSRSHRTPTRRTPLKPAVFKHLDPANTHKPGFSPANWKEGQDDIDEPVPAFDPPSTSSPRTVFPLPQDEEVDDLLGGPSFARAPKMQKDRSRSAESTSLSSHGSFQRPQRATEAAPMSIAPSTSSTSQASSLASLAYPPPIDEIVQQQQTSTTPLVTSLPSEDEDAVANMILDAPLSSQIDPEDKVNTKDEVVEGTDGEDERPSLAEQLETTKRPGSVATSISPLFTQSSRNATPMIASSCSPPAKESESASKWPQELEVDMALSTSPAGEETPRPAETLWQRRGYSRRPLAKSSLPPSESPMPPITRTPPEVIEIGSSPPSPPHTAPQREPRKSAPAPSPSVSVIEISSDEDDEDVLPQIAAKKATTSMVQVKTEKPDDNPVPKAPEAEEPVTEPPVSITLQRATPEPEPQPAQEPATPAPKAKSGSLLDDLLRRQLSPITPLPSEEVNKLKPKKVFDPKKYADALQDDENDVVPAKRLAKRPVRSSPRISRGGSQDSATIVKDKGASKKGSIGTPAEKGSKGLLKLSKRKGDNLAATRIKKRKTTRKVLKSEEEDTPPLKKASMRPRSSTLTVSAKASKVGLKKEETSSPTRKPKGRPKKKRPEWPEPLPVTPDALQPMIKCDGCSVWFHYSCVAIPDDDVRLKDDEIFYCPACTAGVALSRKNMQKDPSDSADQVCGRPECKIETSYFLAKFVGRRRVLRNSTLVPQYLVKWEGWRLASATWENLQDLGIDNPEEYVETLEKELQDQDVDINKDENEYNVVLLQQAKDAGWCPNGGYNPKWRAPHYDSADDLEYDEAP